LRLQQAEDQLQQRALAAGVRADDAEEFAVRDRRSMSVSVGTPA
jgi:hypothetical protein